MESSDGIEKTSIAMRALLAVAGGLVVIIGIPLYLVPQNSEEYFSWSVTPQLSAAFLGGAYLSAAVIEFAAARERIWANARIAVPAVLVFTSLTLLVTLGSIDQYHFKAPGLVQSVGTWAWLVVYVVVPPIMALVLLIQLLRGGSDPERHRPLPTSLRAGLTIGAIVLFGGGVMLLLAPTTADWLWPWPVSQLTGRAFGAWMVGFGIAMSQIAWEGDWRRARPATVGAGVLGALQLLAVLRYPGVFEWDTPQPWVYLAIMIGFVVLGIWGWRAARVQASPISGDEVTR